MKHYITMSDHARYMEFICGETARAPEGETVPESESTFDPKDVECEACIKALEARKLKDGEFIFRARGPGSNWLPCFICGHQPKHKCQMDMASFVDPKLTVVFPLKDKDDQPIASHPILDWFHKLDVLVGKFDYREHEPNWLQVKLGACGEHEPNLVLLCELTHANKGVITERILKSCIPGRKVP